MESSHFKSVLIAPCGMNCGVCKWYLAYLYGVPKERGKVSHCAGCRPRSKNCYIKRGCRKLSKNQLQFCYECSEMPCKHLAHLEKRYRERYGTSLIENLKILKGKGMEQFLLRQEERFKCTNCGDVVSIHGGQCYSCKKITQIEPNF